jgi:hypothetical protein
MLMAIPVSAHTPMLYVEDYGDGTIFLEGGFSDGSSTAGTEILLIEDKKYEKKKEVNTEVRDKYLTLIFNNENFKNLRDIYLKHIKENGSHENYSELLKNTEVKDGKIVFNKKGKQIDFKKIKPEFFKDKLIIYKSKLDDFGTLNVPKPEGSYLVILNAGPGHIVEKEGPILTEEEKAFLEE